MNDTKRTKHNKWVTRRVLIGLPETEAQMLEELITKRKAAIGERETITTTVTAAIRALHKAECK
jgi:hypothetical protein